jgi:uncharacterized phage protein (TIGR01671 family)
MGGMSLRDIKFRAWDKQRREFLSGGEVFIAIQPGKNPKNIIYLDIIKDPDMFKDRFILQQFTGLRDKRGREIYEGDIVAAWSQGSKGTFEVRWRQEALPCWILYPAWQKGESWKLHGTQRQDGLWYDDVEIIGNIHNNPELITGVT